MGTLAPTARQLRSPSEAPLTSGRRGFKRVKDSREIPIPSPTTFQTIHGVASGVDGLGTNAIERSQGTKSIWRGNGDAMECFLAAQKAAKAEESRRWENAGSGPSVKDRLIDTAGGQGQFLTDGWRSPA